MLKNLIPDLKFALRMFRKKPGFAILALSNLALGIGVTTAIFSAVNAILLQPLPYAKQDQLVFIWDTQRDKPNKLTYPVSAPNFRDWQENNHVFESMSAYSFDYFNLVGTDRPERLFAAYASSNLLTTLGVTPNLGHSFSVTPGQSEPLDQVLISDALWKRSLGANPQVVGRTLTLNGRSFTVVGVLPPDFQIPRQVSLGVIAMDDVDLIIPLAFLFSVESAMESQRARHFLHAVARLKPNIEVDQAGSEMTAIARSLEERYPDANANFTVHLVPVHQQITGRIRPALLLLLGAVGLVLLIACANVANLLLARYAGRQKEFALRTALGAGRGRLVQQLLTEGLLLWLIGGALGVLLALGATKALVALNPSDIPRIKEISVDGWVLGFALLISLGTGVLFVLVPMIQQIRPDLNKELKEGERTSSAAPLSRRLRSALVISEMALALVLLIGAGLLIKSFSRALSVDMGFDSRNILTSEVFLPPQKYDRPPQFMDFHRQLLTKLKSAAGVESAATVNVLPLKGSMSVVFSREADPPPAAGQEYYVSQRIVSPDYFKVMRIPLREGRLFTEADTDTSPPVVVISSALAKKYWGDQSPLGSRVSTTATTASGEIVGVVGDVRETGIEESDLEPEIYVPYQQQPWPGFTLMVRSSSDPRNLTGTIQREVWSIDKDQPIGKSALMDEVLAEKLSQRRLNVFLLGVFGAVALLLALVGIYGVISYTVTQRTHELGLRMALGAQPRHILRLIVAHGMTLALIGVGIGLVAAFLLSSYLTTLVYDVSVTDPIIFVICALVLCAPALIASYLPARRATRVDPMTALRHD